MISLPASVLAVCKKRGWRLDWESRAANLLCESAELMEAIRGKHGDPIKEAGDVLFVLMSITEANGIDWNDVVAATEAKVAELNVRPPYNGESKIF